MPTNPSPLGGTVIQGSFRNGVPNVLQALLATTPSNTVQAKAPLPFSEQPIQAKPVVQSKVIAPPPIRFPNQTSTAQAKVAVQSKVVAPPPIRFPGQPPITAQTKLSAVPVAPTPVRFTVPLPQPTVQSKILSSVTVQSKAIQLSGGGQAFQVPPTLSLSSPSGGFRLPEAIQRKMEAFFNTSFEDVRVHVGPQASSIGALAFTHGSNLYFAPGQYNPTTMHGQRLLGHELTHVVQQRTGRVKNPFGSGIAVVQDARLEGEAEKLGLMSVHSGRIDFCKVPFTGNTVQAMEDSEEVRKKKEMMRLRRMARSTVSYTGNREVDEKLQEEGRQRLEATKKSDAILKEVKQEPWAQKRLKKTRAEAKFDLNARRGETTRWSSQDEVRSTGVDIKLGLEALPSIEMGRITLRHELDHAKLIKDDKKISLGSYEAFYHGRGEESTKKDTFDYELEELLVRLRDWQRAKQGKIQFNEHYSGEEAARRIKEQFARLFKASDIQQFDREEIQEIVRKVKEIAVELGADLE